MIRVSEPTTAAPEIFETELQEAVYKKLDELHIKYQRVDTDEVITMEDCKDVNDVLEMDMVKTLFLCNSKKTKFYLYITGGNKPFKSREFCDCLGVSRLSFAPKELMDEMLGTKIGAATVFSVLLDSAKDVQVVFDKTVIDQKYYGCSDGTTTSYMKILTKDITDRFLKSLKRDYRIVDTSFAHSAH